MRSAGARDECGCLVEPVGEERQRRLRDRGLADWPAECATRVVVACPLCASADADRVGSHDRYGWPVNAKRCRECGLVYLGRTFTYDGAQTFYASVYRPLVNAWHDKPHGYDWRAETQAYRALCRPYWPTVPHDRWLDVGGDACNPEHDSGLIELLPVERQYDLVTCCQTLDHLIDPVTAFHKFAQLVRIHGHLWVDVVDYQTTQELKADHPLNWTWRTLCGAIHPRHWRLGPSVRLDDRHLGVLLERW